MVCGLVQLAVLSIVKAGLSYQVTVQRDPIGVILRRRTIVD